MTAYTPNLPALSTALPGDHTRAPQTEFIRARQVLFLENLSITGSVRSAASAAGPLRRPGYGARAGRPVGGWRGRCNLRVTFGGRAARAERSVRCIRLRA